MVPGRVLAANGESSMGSAVPEEDRGHHLDGFIGTSWLDLSSGDVSRLDGGSVHSLTICGRV